MTDVEGGPQPADGWGSAEGATGSRMEWSLKKADNGARIEIDASGPWDMVEGIRILRKMWTTMEATGIDRVLWNLEGVRASGVSSDEVRGLAGLQLKERPALPASKAAVVVARDLEFGLGRMLEAFLASGPVDLQVFRTLSQARSWLAGGP